MKRKRTAALAVLLSCLFCSFPLSAAGQGGNLEQWVNLIEETYGIAIRYDTDQNGEAIIRTRDMMVLDEALSYVTSGIVRQVSSFYEGKTGEKITYYYTDKAYDLKNPELIVLGQFDEEKSTVYVYVPSDKGAYTTGSAPITILHEFAHAYHKMVAGLYGAEKMEREWTALNGDVSNNEGYMVYPYNKTVFISSYAASGYQEDFAETFAHAFVRHKEGLGFSHRIRIGEKQTAIGKKVAYIEALLPRTLNDAQGAVSNLRRVYSAPVFLYYQGVRLSGEDMQFMGYAAPRNVLGSVLSYYGIASDSSKWIKEIGGWQVKSTSGQYYLAFPGGACQTLDSPLQAA